MHMDHRHKAATMFLLFVLLLGGLGLLTAGLSAGQHRTVQGLITDAINPNILLADVTVTLFDAHGQKAPQVFTTTPLNPGVYGFSPDAGFYFITVRRADYFDNETEVFRFDDTTNLVKDIEMEIMPLADLTLTVHVDSMAGVLGNATVEVFNATRGQSLGSTDTNASGNATFTLWNGTFDIRVEKEGFETEVVEDFRLTATDTRNVSLDGGIQLVGIAREPDGTFITSGLVAFLFNIDEGTPAAKRLLLPNVTVSSYSFFAYPGNFTLIVDADGKEANITTLRNVTADDRIDRFLEPSLEERVDIEIRYANGNWSRLNLWRNLTFNDDSTFPGLPFAFIRHLRLQIDLALGNGDGVLNETERSDFTKFLEEVGPKHVDTGGFFTTNGLQYLSDTPGGMTDYNVSFETFPLTTGQVNITSLANYTLVGALSAGQERYFVNVTAPHDAEAEVRVNTTYALQVVPSYERVQQTTTGSVDLQGYVRIVIDPQVAPGDFRVDLELAKSVAGMARVLVVAPPDRFTETNASVDNYTAIVPTNESMTFTAEESTDPNSPDGRINPDSNFTWTFTNDTMPQIEAFGIRPNVTFAVMGNFTGNLTITEVGRNTTFRNFTLHVDGILPIAFLENNVTGFGIDANNMTVNVKEGQVVAFFAGNSTDRVHNQMEGAVSAFRWDFDGDGVVDATGRSVDWTFDTPGEFTVNLTAVDQAGHESLNATLTAIVSDTSPPDVEFRILDEDFQEVPSLVEQVVYLFDGSDTTDNLDSVQNLTFAWDFGDDTTASGVNVTHTYADSGNFDVVLNVTDRAGNEGNATRSVVVGVDPPTRPDLEIEPNVMHIDPASPEESTFFGSVSLLITFNVTNRPGRAPATDVQVSFFAFQFGQSPGDPVPITAVFKDVNGTPTDNTLDPGETKIVEFTWITGPLGNYTLRANVTDPEEPELFIGPRNTVELQVDIREAAWKQPLLIGSIIAVIVGIPVALFLRRRLRGRGRGRERITK
ncbi:MAG: PKD domain-containing protein [Thermoplasmata archaeon]